MVRIVHSDNANRTLIDIRARATRDALRASVRPIHVSPDGLRMHPMGTCVFIEVDDIKYVVSAAHVLDRATDGSGLFVIGSTNTKPVQIRGKFVVTTLPPGGRRRDPIDIGVWQVPQQVVPFLGNVRFLRMSDFSHNRMQSTRRLYMAMGYPYSRNKRGVDQGSRRITPTVRIYTGRVVQVPKLAAKLGVSDASHFFLHFEKISHLEDGCKTNTFSPYGMSGGALVDLGEIDSISQHSQSAVGHVAGLLLEWHKQYRVIVAIKVQHVIKAIFAYSKHS
jgi:hypothetical protein